jgi:CRISPR-associated protein Csc2
MLSSLGPVAARLAPAYSNYPNGRFVQIFILRTTRSETIFRTEGTGEPLCREALSIGGEIRDHIVITKRKQVAVERRTGRELLRRQSLLFQPLEAKEGALCALNTGAPCERCLDCWLYGYAVGAGGAQRSRVLTEDAFSLLPAGEITDTRTFNAIFENGTMRNPETGDASQALGESEYVRPGSHFLDVEVLRDVTGAELAYVLGNILRSTRYGAASSRIGRVDNEILALALSDQELDSNLSWHAATCAALTEGDRHPLPDERARALAIEALAKVGTRAFGKVDWVRGDALERVLQEVRAAHEGDLKWLAAATESYPKREAKVKKSGKSK